MGKDYDLAIANAAQAHEEGMQHHIQGRYPEALTYFGKSLAAFERLRPLPNSTIAHVCCST